MPKPKFALRQRIRVHHVHAQWGTVIERTESVERETRYLMRIDAGWRSPVEPVPFGEAELIESNATEPPRDPFATDVPAAAVKPRRKAKR